MAAIRDSAYGGIAIDSIVLSPECRPSTGNPFSGLLTHHITSHLICREWESMPSVGWCIFNLTFSSWTANYTLAEFPKSPKEPCTEPNKMCNFHGDCPNAEDETKCGESIHPVSSVQSHHQVCKRFIEWKGVEFFLRVSRSILRLNQALGFFFFFNGFYEPVGVKISTQGGADCPHQDIYSRSFG